MSGLRCRSEIPAPASLDTGRLPHDFVTISQGVCWLAGQPIGDWYDYVKLGAELIETATDLSGLDEADRFGPEYAALCESFANQLAQKEVRDQAALAILKACTNGNLDAYGEPEGNNRRIEEIDRSEFLTSKEFSYVEDILIPGKSESHEETALALSSGSWKHVRFHQDDFLRLWTVDLSSDEGENSRQRKPLKRELAAQAHRRPYPNGHGEFGLQWVQVQDQIGNEIKTKVSIDTIKRGLAELGPNDAG